MVRLAAMVAFVSAVLLAPVAYCSDLPIKHVIMIMQENRSFDSYFGAFPGADGFDPTTCVPITHGQPTPCVRPFHDPHDVNAGGPHNAAAAQADLDNGIVSTNMDGFVAQQAVYAKAGSCGSSLSPNCVAYAYGAAQHDAMGYHTAAEIPNYWRYAAQFVLQDQMFTGTRSWSWPSHLDLASEWVASCSDSNNAMSCVTSDLPRGPTSGTRLPWASLFQLLDTHAVSWKWYLGNGTEPDCEQGEMTCAPQIQAAGLASFWNPPPYFNWVADQGAAYVKLHNPALDQFLLDIKQGTLPQVAWVVPADVYSEHPPNGVDRGMVYVTSLVNAVMQSPYWADTAIFISWDDWGGFYDHVPPPNVDAWGGPFPIDGFGLRVPGIMISAYAKSGAIDHQLLSLDSYATLIEDLFMNGARLDPGALGTPDNRPTIRDALTQVQFPDGRIAPVGNLLKEFDFHQSPLPPLVQSTDIPTGITVVCSASGAQPCTSDSVTVTWDTLDAATPFTFHVERDGVELPQCTGHQIYCIDTPGHGTFLYRAYSVKPGGAASPLSAAAEADVP